MRARRIAALALAAGAAGWGVVAGAQEFRALKGHGGPVMDVAVSPAGAVATASFDNSVGLWPGTAESAASPSWLEGHEAAATVVRFFDDGTLVSGGDDFAVIAWTPTESGDAAMRVLGRHRGKISGLALSAEAGLVASASWDGTIGLWPISPSGAPPPEAMEGHDQAVNDVAFSRDGRLVYSASADGTVRTWDAHTRREIATLARHGFGINKIALDDDAGWLAYGAVDGTTRVIDADTGESIADFSADRRPILGMASHAGTRQLAVGDGQGFIMVVDTGDWRVIRDFRAMRDGPVWALAYAPDGSTIYAAGIDDVAFAWPVAMLDAVTPGDGGSGSREFLRDAAAMPNGERQFVRKCSICHSLEPGASRKAGPTLHGLFGRPAATVAGYRYSRALEVSGIVWNEETVDELFDAGPDHYVPGTKMPMQVIVNPEDRADLVAYLRQAAGGALAGRDENGE